MTVGLIVAVAAGTGCVKQNGVTVTYGPILNAPLTCTFNTASGPSPTTDCNNPNNKPITEIGQVSCIYSISNVGKDAKDFLFDITNLNFNGNPQPIYNGLPFKFKPFPKTVMVKAGTQVKDLGVIVLSANVKGESEEEMAAQIPKFIYKNEQVPDVGVLFVAYPPNATPKWYPNTSLGDVDVPVCQGPN